MSPYMAKCDLCGESCSSYDMQDLRGIYRTSGVTDLCPKCVRWADKELDEIRGTIAPEMQRRIAARAAGKARPSLWRRIFKLNTNGQTCRTNDTKS